MTTTSRDNISLGAAGLAEGTNLNTFQIGNILHYTIAGRAYRKAVTDNLPFSAGHAALAVKQKCAFFVMLNTAGDVTTVQSAIVPNEQSNSYAAGAWDWPFRESLCCIGAIVVSTNNAATFTPNTTDLGAADVVDTFANVAMDYGLPVAY